SRIIQVGSRVKEVEVVLDSGSRIQGLVTDDSKQPMPDVWVSADCQPRDDGAGPKLWAPRPAPGFLLPGKRAMSDAEGPFTIGGLAPDAVCTLRAEQPNGPVGVRPGAHAGEDAL